MQKVLGLDLGTNSIGWAVVERERTPIMTDGLRDYEEHFKLSDKGVLIFSEGVKIEKGNESSKAAERTEHRSARRIKFRRKLRKYETLKALIDYGMCPLTMPELKQWRHYTDPETGKQSNFKHYPDKPEFRAWLQTLVAKECLDSR